MTSEACVKSLLRGNEAVNAQQLSTLWKLGTSDKLLRLLFEGLLLMLLLLFEDFVGAFDEEEGDDEEEEQNSGFIDATSSSSVSKCLFICEMSLLTETMKSFALPHIHGGIAQSLSFLFINGQFLMFDWFVFFL